jgi:aminoglycoside phosphotransferase (APT) family kinase protein
VVPDAGLARRLVARQFPGWADLPVAEVSRQGWDNRTFRLGSDLTVRLPSGAGTRRRSRSSNLRYGRP